jgi:hypothetical protein
MLLVLLVLLCREPLSDPDLLPLSDPGLLPLSDLDPRCGALLRLAVQSCLRPPPLRAPWIRALLLLGFRPPLVQESHESQPAGFGDLLAVADHGGGRQGREICELLRASNTASSRRLRANQAVDLLFI